MEELKMHCRNVFNKKGKNEYVESCVICKLFNPITMTTTLDLFITLRIGPTLLRSERQGNISPHLQTHCLDLERVPLLGSQKKG